MTGFDVSDPDNPMVIVNDPGHPDGQGHAYPLDRFMDAWENSNFIMTATDDPLPAFTAMNIRQHVDQWMSDNGVVPHDTAYAASSTGDFDWNAFADSFHEIAKPVMSILQDIAGVITGVAGVVIAGNLLDDSLSSDDLAYVM